MIQADYLRRCRLSTKAKYLAVRRALNKRKVVTIFCINRTPEHYAETFAPGLRWQGRSTTGAPNCELTSVGCHPGPTHIHRQPGRNTGVTHFLCLWLTGGSSSCSRQSHCISLDRGTILLKSDLESSVSHHRTHQSAGLSPPPYIVAPWWTAITRPWMRSRRRSAVSTTGGSPFGSSTAPPRWTTGAAPVEKRI